MSVIVAKRGIAGSSGGSDVIARKDAYQPELEEDEDCCHRQAFHIHEMHHRLTSTGKVERRPVSTTIRNQRRKLKALLRIHASYDTMNSVIASYNGVYKELKYRRGQNDLHLLKRRISRRQ